MLKHFQARNHKRTHDTIKYKKPHYKNRLSSGFNSLPMHHGSRCKYPGILKGTFMILIEVAVTTLYDSAVLENMHKVDILTTP